MGWTCGLLVWFEKCAKPTDELRRLFEMRHVPRAVERRQLAARDALVHPRGPLAKLRIFRTRDEQRGWRELAEIVAEPRLRAGTEAAQASSESAGALRQ